MAGAPNEGITYFRVFRGMSQLLGKVSHSAALTIPFPAIKYIHRGLPSIGITIGVDHNILILIRSWNTIWYMNHMVLTHNHLQYGAKFRSILPPQCYRKLPIELMRDYYIWWLYIAKRVMSTLKDNNAYDLRACSSIYYSVEREQKIMKCGPTRAKIILIVLPEEAYLI